MVQPSWALPTATGLSHVRLPERCLQAERVGIRKLIAVVGDSSNGRSIGAHSANGFELVGTLSACGWKFDRWLDVVLMEKSLGLGKTTAPLS